MFEIGSEAVRDAAWLAELVPAFGELGGDPAVPDAELLAQLAGLERMAAATAAALARVTDAFVSSRLAGLASVQPPRRERDERRWAARDAARAAREAAPQVALARRISPWQGARAVSCARRLVNDMPATMAALATGVLSERRAALLERETSLLTAEERTAVDAAVCQDQHALRRLGDRGLERVVRGAVYRCAPQRARERCDAAAKERRVTFRPLPDAMCRVSTLLPIAQGAAMYAALSHEADSARAAGDPRGRGQVMADTLVERVTGQSRAADVPVELQIVISDAALLNTGPGSEDAARLIGHGIVPAGWVRDLVASRLSDDPDTRAAQVWLRRLYATPDSSTLVSMESSRRLFGAGLRRFLVTRDDTCRTPWCDAPIRHLDLPYFTALRKLRAVQRGPSAGTTPATARPRSATARACASTATTRSSFPAGRSSSSTTALDLTRSDGARPPAPPMTPRHRRCYPVQPLALPPARWSPRSSSRSRPECARR